MASRWPLPINTFICLAVSVSASEGTFKAYVNNQLVRTFSGVTPPRHNSVPVSIGNGGYYGYSGSMVGSIDELKIYRKALSAAEITANCR